MSYNLITAGCLPAVSAETAVLNSILVSEDIRAVIDKVGRNSDGRLMPDISKTQLCLTSAINSFRKDVSIENAAVFQGTVLTCLNDLKSQATNTYCSACEEGVSAFKSTIDLDTTTQFVSRPIVVSVTLNDPGGHNLCINLPSDCIGQMEDGLKGTTTFGTLSKFKYDGVGAFVADLASTFGGSGTISITFNGNLFNNFVLGVGNNSSSIIENSQSFSFIGVVSQEQVRRDETDTSKD